MTDRVSDSVERVLIAGASGGIGCELFRLFAQSGAQVGAHYFENRRALEETIQKHSLEESRIHLCQAELTTEEAARNLVGCFVRWAGGIDVIVQLTGGVSSPKSWDLLTGSDWQRDLDLNLTAPFFLAQTAMQHMKAGGGRILLTSTGSAKHGGGRTSMAYGVAKAGIECVVKGLAREGAPFGIVVNAVCPGFVDTQFHTRFMRRTSEDLRQRIGLIPLKRPGTASEVAALIHFLASSASDYITGECISISGGDWL